MYIYPTSEHLNIKQILTAVKGLAQEYSQWLYLEQPKTGQSPGVHQQENRKTNCGIFIKCNTTQ